MGLFVKNLVGELTPPEKIVQNPPEGVPDVSAGRPPGVALIKIKLYPV